MPIQNNMLIDENILNCSFPYLIKKYDLIELDMNNFKEHGLASYDYSTKNGMLVNDKFLEFTISKIAFKVDQEKNAKEILLKIKTFDLEFFYKKIVDKYGMPNSSNLSKHYIEKHGFEIPSKIEMDSLQRYYEKLPKPKLADFPEIQSLAWYDLDKSNKTDMLIRNKTHPTDVFKEKEIWVVIKRSK